MKDHAAEVVEVEVFPHENADRLELAQPIGTDWVVVVGKEQFKTGDTAIYVPVDSIVPDDFVKKHLAGSKIQLHKNRIRSVKIRGVISQGLLVAPDAHHQLGQDVTKELGIKKYEPNERDMSIGGGSKHRALPKKTRGLRRHVESMFKKYTKISNHKNNKGVLRIGERVVVTEKIHGTNFRAGRVYIGGMKRRWYVRVLLFFLGLLGYRPERFKFVVGSHNVVKWYEDNVYYRAAKEAGLDSLGEEWNGFIFYGEVYGHGIQELSYGVPPGEQRLAIIDIMYQNSYGQSSYLPWGEVEQICERLGLETAPVLYAGPWNRRTLELAEGPSVMPDARHHREGFVVRPSAERSDVRCGRVILKRISDTYLLGKNRTEFH